jgi:hypothetical protein
LVKTDKYYIPTLQAKNFKFNLRKHNSHYYTENKNHSHQKRFNTVAPSDKQYLCRSLMYYTDFARLIKPTFGLLITTLYSDYSLHVKILRKLDPKWSKRVKITFFTSFSRSYLEFFHLTSKDNFDENITNFIFFGELCVATFQKVMACLDLKQIRKFHKIMVFQHV